jgi:hypothetical protein
VLTGVVDVVAAAGEPDCAEAMVSTITDPGLRVKALAPQPSRTVSGGRALPALRSAPIAESERSVVDRRCGGNRPDRPLRRGWEVPLSLRCALARRSASSVTGGIPGRLASGRHHKHGGRGPGAVRFPRRMDPASAGRWPVNHPAHHDRWRRATSGPARGLRQAHRSFVLDQLSVAGDRDVQPAPPPVVPAGASPGSTVLPGTTWLPPAARVTSTRRAWALGDAGMVTCRTPSA